MIGKTISHYKILEKLGAGGMGVVYKAEDIKLKRTVALKFLTPQAVGTEEEKTRFIHEAQAAAALSHPNICTVYEIDETEGQIFIAMEYIDGQSLKEKIESGPLKLDQAMDIAIQVGEGLQEAHEKGIVHRDIKSANVMVTGRGQAKITDFGLAKLAGQTKLTKTGRTMGTIAYMSPEQTRGEEVDHRSDIWSFGVMLYQMITGQLPFKGEYEQAVVYSILNEEPEPITGLRTGVPVELERITRKCMSKDRAERYQTAGDLAADLHHIQRVMAAQNRQPRQRLSRATTLRASRWWPWVVGVSVGLIIAFVIFFRFFIVRERHHVLERKMLVVLPFENLGPAEDEYFAAGVTEEITNRLASVSGLGVISRTSAVQYAETNKTIKQIGKELGVQYVLEGTVRWAQAAQGLNRVRISPQLIRVSDNIHLWAEVYDRVINDIFEIQSEIAKKVVEQLGVTLLEPERRAVEALPTKNLEAYQAYLRGRYYIGRPHFSIENWKQAVQSYQRAVELYPDFVLAWIELSRVHARFYYFWYDHSEERQALAKRALVRAVELAPDAPEVHLALGYYHFWIEREAKRALEEFAIAARLLPESAEVLESKAEVLRMQGRMEEAVGHYQRAAELSPLNPSPVLDIGVTLWWLRKYPQALEACNRAIALAPDEPWTYLTKVFNYWSWKGATNEARAALDGVPKEHEWAPWAWFWQEMFEGRYREAIERLASTTGEWIRLKMWAMPKSLLAAHAYELLNEPQLARAAYESAKNMLETETRAQPEDPRYHSSLGIAYAALGRKEEAIREGRRAVELLPLSKDAVYGLGYVQDLAFIYTVVGEQDAALEQLEYLLSIPGYISVSYLKLDPRWNRLRSHAGFQRLLEKYSGDS